MVENDSVIELHPKVLLDAALKYALRGFRVLPLNSIRQGGCTCGDSDCRSPGKHPLTAHGATEASRDEMTIRGWWSKWPTANIGLAMGDAGCVALDVDTRNNGHLSWEALIQANGALPETPTQRSGNGWHYLVRIDTAAVKRCRGKLAQGIDVKANGYIVAEPSIHHSGRRYAWDDGLDLLAGFTPARAPVWLERMLMEPAAEAGAAPSSPNLGNYTLPAQLAEAADALTVLDAEDYHQWIEAGMALHATGLGDLAYQVWVDWSGRSGKFDHKVQRAKWLSFSTNRAAGVTIKTLFSRAQSAGWKNPMAGTSSAPSTPEPEITISDLEKQLLAFDAFADPFTAIPHFVDRWIPHNEVTLLAGHGGSGKSYVAMSLAIHVALGRTFCGLPTIAAPVLFFSGEDGAQVVLRRFHSLCKALSVAPADLEGKLLLLDASDIDPALHRDNRGVTETKLLGALSELVTKRNIGLVVVDNASDTFDDDEIKRARVRQFVRSLRSRIARPERAVLLLAHVNKVSAIGGRDAGREDYSGSTAWHNSVRSRLSLNVEKDEDCLTIEHQKANLGPRAKTVRLRWHDGVPLEDGSFTDLGAAANAKLMDGERRKSADLAKGVLGGMIKDFNNRGEMVTTSNTGGFSVWHLLSKRAGFPKSVKTSSDLMDLLAEMQAEGSIYRSTFKTKDRKLREVFVAGSAPMPTGNDENEAH